MSFTKNPTENTETTPTGLTSTIANFLPILTLAFEQVTGQKIPQMQGTMADIANSLLRIEQKLDNLERNCAEQFTHQENQLNSLQQISKLVSTEKTKAIHFANNKQIAEIEE